MDSRVFLALVFVASFPILVSSNHLAYAVFANEIDIAIGSGASPSAACVSTHNCFNPNPLHVNLGATVTWNNTDTVSHTVTSGTPSDNNPGSIFDSSLIQHNHIFQFTFPNPGTFDYFDTVHPWMSAQVIVDAPAGTPTLKVIKKIINDNGGTLTLAGVTLKIDGNTVTNNTANSISAGTHTVSETAIPGYTATFSGDCDLSGNITLVTDDNKVCIITNNDIAPTLKVIKKIINDNGGTLTLAGVTLKIDGSTVTNNTANSVSSGLHTVSETAIQGYTATFSGDCDSSGNITFSVGNKVCIITNNDIVPNTVSIVPGSGASASAACVSTHNCFNPNPLHVNPGATVTWTNDDAVSHTVTSGTPSDNNPGSLFDSSLIQHTHIFQFTFPNPGTFDYFDAVHPWMSAQVIVDAPATCSPPVSGDWTITLSCTMASTSTAPANVIVNNGAVLIIPNGITLTVHFTTNHIIIHQGGGVLVKSGGKLN